jgi:glycosyltransferase involved in cell wall biosynthesis
MRHEATEGRSVAAPVQGGRAAGHGGAQRGCARTGGGKRQEARGERRGLRKASLMSHPQTQPENATVNAADTLRVSIVIPCYRQAQFLPEAVASVVAQTFTDWEIIIVDDGSPDDTAAVAQRLIAAHPDRRIRLIRQENRGLAEARNAGIRVARAPYILPLDADDMLEPEMLAQTVAALDAHPEVGFVYTDVRRFGAENNILRTRPYSLNRLRFQNLMMPATLFRREAWGQVGGFRMVKPVQGCEDWDFWISLAEAGWEGLHIAQPLLRYRRTAGSMVSTVRRYNLEVRAHIFLNHQRLYEPDVLAWARRVTSPAWSVDGKLRSPWRWLLAYLGYLALIRRYYPLLLLPSLVRPIFWRLPIPWQGRLRALARLARLQQ